MNTINAVKNLIITEKGKLRWEGSFENLESLMNELLEKQVKWSSPGGYCKLLETEGFEMRWYSNNYSLTIKGETSEEMKSQLRVMAKLVDKETEASDVLFEENDSESGDNASNGMIKNNPTSHEAANYDKVLDSIRNLEQRFTNEINDLLQEIRQPKTTEVHSTDEYRDFLVKDHTKLKEENVILSDQVNNYKYITSDLNTRIKELENEKKSLITVIKILQGDQENCGKETTWNVVKNRKLNQSINTLRDQHSGEKNHNRTVETTNQYSVLSDNESDNEIQILSQKLIPKNRNQAESPNYTQRPNQDKRRDYSAYAKQRTDNNHQKDNNNERTQDPRRIPRASQSRVAILGDSMLKHVNTRKIQHGIKQKVVVKTFPGAGVEDMNHYIKPTLLTQPSKLIIHVGTNDLQRNTPNEILTHVRTLGEGVMQDNKDIELVLSEIIMRSDKETLANKVNEYNRGLDQLCSEHNWGLIKHNNITTNHLNDYGLHLNKQGTSALAKNIKQYLSKY